MKIWYVAGVRHDAFVDAETPEEAIQKALPVVGDWESPQVYRAEWKEGLLRPYGEPVPLKN